MKNYATPADMFAKRKELQEKEEARKLAVELEQQKEIEDVVPKHLENFSAYVMSEGKCDYKFGFLREHIALALRNQLQELGWRAYIAEAKASSEDNQDCCWEMIVVYPSIEEAFKNL